MHRNSLTRAICSPTRSLAQAEADSLIAVLDTDGSGNIQIASLQASLAADAATGSAEADSFEALEALAQDGAAAEAALAALPADEAARLRAMLAQKQQQEQRQRSASRRPPRRRARRATASARSRRPARAPTRWRGRRRRARRRRADEPAPGGRAGADAAVRAQPARVVRQPGLCAAGAGGVRPAVAAAVGDGRLARRGRGGVHGEDAATLPDRLGATLMVRRAAAARPPAPRAAPARARAAPPPVPLPPPVPTPAPSAPQANHSRVVDVLRTWDTDGDGVISRKEFEKGLRALGLHGDQAEIDELFASMDVNGDGTLDYTELHRLLRVGAAAKKSSYLRDAVTNKPLRMPTSPSPGGGAMAHLGGRESPRCATTLAQSAPPVSEGGSPAPVAVREETWPEGLRNVLLREMGRVIDLFRHWEGGEAGRITVDHFKAGLYILGHHTTTADVLELYAAMGVDVASAGYAALPFRELRAQLRVAAQRGRSHYLRAAIRQGLQLEAAGPRGATHSGVVPTTPATGGVGRRRRHRRRPRALRRC